MIDDTTLSQDEINDLISGPVSDSENETDVSGLLDSLTGGTSPSSEKNDKKYEPFRLGEQRGSTSRNYDKTIGTLHQQMARSLGISLSGMLGGLIDVEYETIDALSYGDYIMSLPEISCLGRIKLPGAAGSIIVEVDLELVFPIVERLLGARGLTTASTRRLTEIELRIVERLFEEIIISMNSTWRQLKDDVKFVLDSVETEADSIQGGTTADQMTYVVISIKFADIQGKISFCYSSSVIEPILSENTLEELGSHSLTVEIEEKEKAFQQSHVKSGASKTNVWIRAVLPKTSLPIRDLSELKVGSMIELDTQVRNNQIIDPIIVEVEKQPRFYGRLGRYDKNRAIKITSLYEED